jgi:hypothetical protein
VAANGRPRRPTRSPEPPPPSPLEIELGEKLATVTSHLKAALGVLDRVDAMLSRDRSAFRTVADQTVVGDVVAVLEHNGMRPPRNLQTWRNRGD